MSRRLIEQNPTPFIMSINTRFSYVDTSQCFSMKCSLGKTNIGAIWRDWNDPVQRPRATGVGSVLDLSRCFHKAPVKAIIIAMFFKLPHVAAPSHFCDSQMGEESVFCSDTDPEP